LEENLGWSKNEKVIVEKASNNNPFSYFEDFDNLYNNKKIRVKTK
jgi:hypothetical protein